MAICAWIEELLVKRGVEFETRSHPNAYTAQQLAHGEHVKGRRVAKVVVVHAGPKRLMLVLPATHRVSLGRVRELAGTEDVHLASENEMRALFPDCEVGAEPPLRHGREIEIWTDPSMTVEGEFVFAGGTHRDSVHMPFDDWFEIERPRVADFAVEPGRLPPKPAEAF